MKSTWNTWKKIAHVIGDFQTTILFSVLYFLIVVPVGLVSNFFLNFFAQKEFPYWSEVTDSPKTIQQMQHE